MGRAHDTRRCAKRTCCLSGKRRFAACSGRNSTVSLHIYSSIQVFFLSFVSRPVDSTRRDQHFFLSRNTPGGAFCPILVLENAPGTLKTPWGRYFRIVLWNAPGGVYSVLYGGTTQARQTSQIRPEKSLRRLSRKKLFHTYSMTLPKCIGGVTNNPM